MSFYHLFAWREWTLYDWGFFIAIVLLFATEITALVRDHDQTLTHKTISWMRERRTWWRRLMVAFFIFWLFYHFGFQFFRG